MDEIIKTFHIDWKLLIAQLINFAIVLFILWKFAIKPLSKVMNKRTKEIEKSLADAKKIEENMTKSQTERENLIKQTKREAQKIIQKSQEEGQKQGAEIVSQAKAEAQNIVTKTKEQIDLEKQKMLKEVKSEVANLVVKTTEKVLAKTVTKEMDEKLIQESLKKAVKEK